MWRNIKAVLVVGLISLTAVSCNSTNNQENKQNKTADNNASNSKVVNLMVNNCFSCHSPTATMDNRIAPPMTHVKSHYLDKYPSKEAFINAMTAYVNSPNKNNAIMYGAINKFGVMPNMQFEKNDIDAIVNYIYSADMGSDEIIGKCDKPEQPTFEKGDYLGLGRHIVMSTKKQLGKNLKKTIKQKGTKAAVTFCNLKAYPITDSMSLVHNAKIYRVSNKNRNANNNANELEANYILDYQSQLDNGKELKPIVNETEDLATFYMPIVTNDMCLKCHGNTNSIDTETLAEIKRLYPKDLATGYSINQVRGIWRVEIKK